MGHRVTAAPCMAAGLRPLSKRPSRLRDNPQPMNIESSHRPRPSHTPVPPDDCVALIDARFLAWLCRQDGPDAPGTDIPDAGLNAMAGLMRAALRDAGVRARIVRTYWYGPKGDLPALDGRVLRFVRDDATDGGASMALAMARDLADLSQRRACRHVLLVSDDDRLLVAVDAAQMAGMQVHLLADESAENLAALAGTDAAWAALLRQADRRVVVPATVLEEAWRGEGEGAAEGARQRGFGASRHAETPRGERRRYPGDGEPHGQGEEESAPREALEAMVRGWWGELDDDERADLLAHLPPRGLPQEADRQLLLRLSRQLGRPLSRPEKVVMRELARGVVEPGPSVEGSAEAPRLDIE